MSGIPKSHVSSFPAYGPMSYIDAAFSTSHLRRFHMCRVQRESHLSDHTVRVAFAFRHFLRMWLDNRDVQAWLDTQPSISITNIRLIGLEMALDHDLLEVLTGDVASHVKTPEIRTQLKDLEKHLASTVEHGEWHFQSTYPETETDSHKVASKLVKLADIAESLIFAYYNQGFGPLMQDRKSRWVNNNYDKMATQYIDNLPEPFFPESFRVNMRNFIVDRKADVAPQHA